MTIFTVGFQTRKPTYPKTFPAYAGKVLETMLYDLASRGPRTRTGLEPKGYAL